MNNELVIFHYSAMDFIIPIYLLLLVYGCTSGDQRATVGDNVNITLSVNFTNSSFVTLVSSYGGFYGSDLFAPSCRFRVGSGWGGYKCSSTNTSISVTVTIYLTDVALMNGGVYTLISDTGAWDNVTLTVCEPANRPVLLSSVNNSLHVLQCKMNSRCFPPCNSCWSNYTYTWHERLSPGVSEASVIDGVTSESYSLAVTLPDGRGYYCSTSVAGIGTVFSVNTFWHVCHPHEGVTCGVCGQDVSMYFVIAPMLHMNLSDSDVAVIKGGSIRTDGLTVNFGTPTSLSQPGNVVPIHPERMCGIVVNSTSEHDSGEYTCTITRHAAGNIIWSKMLNQTLRLCGAPSSPYITAVSSNSTQVLVCILVHDSNSCSVPEHYLWLINGTLSASNINQNMTIDVESCDSTTYACCVAWRSDACVAVSQPYITTTTVSPGQCQVSPSVGPSTVSNTNTLAIILGVTIGGGVLLVVVITVAVVCHRVKQKKNDKPSEPYSYATSPPDPYCGLVIERSNNHPYDLPNRSDPHQISGPREYVNQAHGGYYNTPAQVSAIDNYTPLAARSGEGEKPYDKLAAPHSYYNGTNAQLNR